jgi:hypothetical protein
MIYDDEGILHGSVLEYDPKNEYGADILEYTP